MATIVLTVPNISCAHCERTITSTLTALPGVQRVQVNIPAKQVQVAYNEQLVTVHELSKRLQEEDYPVASIQQGSST
jgi:copper chaperone